MEPPAPPPLPGYVLLKFGDEIKKGDMIWVGYEWMSASGMAGSHVNLATFCRPIPKEQQPDKEWLNPWD